MVDDIRSLIKALDKVGQLKRIDGADWNLEIGTITEIVSQRKGPTLLFDKIKDYPKGYRVIANANTEVAQRIIFGLEEKLSNLEIIRQWKGKWNNYKPVPPVEVNSGPVMQNVFEGDDIDILKFPAPVWHHKDGGRYIGTGVVTITKDPEEGWVNAGTYRVMVHDKKTLGFYVSPGKHARIMREKYWANGESCPVVMCFGPEPLLFAMSMMSFPWGRSELDVVGYLKDRPMKIIKGIITGLPIPANAEIAIEGFSPPPANTSCSEGPFGEWTGYYASGSRNEPVVEIKALYHRNNPILLGQPPLRKVNGLFPIPLHTASPLWNRLEGAHINGIKGVYVHGLGGRLPGVISVKQQYPGHSKEVGTAAAALLTGGALTGKWIIVVDDDIDPSDWDDVMWAVSTRCDPKTSVDIVEGFLTSPLDPSLSPEKRAKGDMTTAKVIIDACRPYYWRDEFPVTSEASDELIKQTIEKWGHLLDKDEG